MKSTSIDLDLLISTCHLVMTFRQNTIAEYLELDAISSLVYKHD